MFWFLLFLVPLPTAAADAHSAQKCMTLHFSLWAFGFCNKDKKWLVLSLAFLYFSVFSPRQMFVGRCSWLWSLKWAAATASVASFDGVLSLLLRLLTRLFCSDGNGVGCWAAQKKKISLSAFTADSHCLFFFFFTFIQYYCQHHWTLPASIFFPLTCHLLNITFNFCSSHGAVKCACFGRSFHSFVRCVFIQCLSFLFLWTPFSLALTIFNAARRAPKVRLRWNLCTVAF